ncbi:signal recognition particle protein [Acidithiobacillus sulfuriphilus]|jgi:signal recognition particle subunit SRP54|uniref:Signal recognition particle protein n=2 Tax=Acidithiobacillus sulfuriphilus TaxID=1867749 RepID=A0A3M8RM70_9PROT|nr:signal recognition particle protein [Acidithiobacillus sulfuriphilus]RNF67690.1 signal recognition particle protein [Acidithiobacillus sulfuriphilus]
MFDNLTQKLTQTFKNLRGQGRLSEENISEALREVRLALLEADVALPVVKDFIGRVKAKAMGEEVTRSLTPGQVFIKIVHDELVHLMGDHNDRLDLSARPPAVILLAGLQGSGKTTTSAKLALWLQEKEKKRVLLVSTDVYRPAAMEQLAHLGRDIGVDVYPTRANERPVDIARRALEEARRRNDDVLIVDTAGRLHIDSEMMAEAQELARAVNPVELLFVVDAMTGQDAVNTAKAFDAALPLTGVILTKTDGDARGGAALSVRAVTGKPIKFLGVGEKVRKGLEPFHPERMASRILGMGDIVSLVEQVQQEVDEDQARRMADKLRKGKGFDLEDFREQLRQLDRMGGMASLMDKLPGMGELPAEVQGQLQDNKQFRRLEAIINSMTAEERRHPDIIKASRRRRIALGSGTNVPEVNRLLKQFEQMQKMLKKMGKGKGGLSRLLGMNPKAMMKGGLPFR